MGTRDYLCITVRGGAPWGFSLRQGNELHHPLLVCQVESRGHGVLAGLCEGDEVVSLNGEPCSDLTLLDSLSLMEASDSLQLLVKRCSVPQLLAPDSQRECSGEAEPNEQALESTTLEIWSPGGFDTRGKGQEACESQDDAYYGETESDREPRSAHLVLEASCRGVAVGEAVELQVSLSDPGCDSTSGGAVTVLSAREDRGQDLDSGSWKGEPVGEPLKQRGDLVTSSSCSLGQVELTLQHSGKGSEGEEQEEEEERGCVLSDPPEEGGSRACVSFRISAEGAESPEERDSESERDLGRPSKHRARHARLRRSESQSEKQVKEAKSKCKRIALLLTAAPNPTNKGVLMFKRRQQRAKKYTLVSYGTGETEPEDEEEDSEEAEDDRAIELTLLATSESEPSEEFLVNLQGRGDVPGHNWDTTLLEVEKKVNAQGEMEHLPGTKGKGALMFARRRQRVDEITAEHEEMRRKGIPVEGVPGEAHITVAKPPQVEDPSYIKTCADQPKQTFQHQQYHEQEQQEHLPTQQYSQTMNGMPHTQSNDMPRSVVPNRTAKPFSGVQNRVPAPFSPSQNVTSPALPSYSEKFRVLPPPVPVNTRPQVWSPTGEQIASRDERISVPAIKTGILLDTRKRGTTKSILPKAPPNASFSMRGDKRAGFESGPEEDYLSLGAEACNFMQTPTVRSKDPPPVLPKPTINPASPPWATGSTTKSPVHHPQSQSPIHAPSHKVMPPQSPQQQSPQRHAAVSPRTPSQPQPQPPMNTWTPPQPQAHPRPPQNTWTPPQPQAHPQPPMNTWTPAHPQAHSQPPTIPWTPQPQKVPVSTITSTETHAPLHQPAKSWNQPGRAVRSTVSLPMNSYSHSKKIAPAVTMGDAFAAAGPERPAMRGRGAELFARRQARMEKFVVDAETVQANKVKPPSPTPSLPSSWKFSPNVRAPPPLSYNPILSPFYPPAAIKQPPPSSPKPKAKSMVKAQPPPKHLSAVDVMKHQPYQLNPSLFTYDATSETKSASPKPAPTPDSSLTYSPSPAPTPSPVPAPIFARGVSKVQPPGQVSVPYPFPRQQLSPESQQPLSPTVHDGSYCQAPARPHAQLPSAYTLPSFSLPPKAASVTGVPAAPRPKFSAKKSLLVTKTWKPVVMGL